MPDARFPTRHHASHPGLQGEGGSEKGKRGRKHARQSVSFYWFYFYVSLRILVFKFMTFDFTLFFHKGRMEDVENDYLVSTLGWNEISCLLCRLPGDGV